jgi:type IV fimbrial biogenesis protein FimT
MIIALAFSAVLAGIAIPSLSALLPTYRLNAAARQIQSELHRIKSQAVAQNADYRLVFLTPAIYRVEKKANAGTYQPTGENKVLPKGIVYGNNSAADISFTPRGTSNSDTIRLCNTRHQGKNLIVFGGTGRIRVVGGPC